MATPPIRVQLKRAIKRKETAATKHDRRVDRGRRREAGIPAMAAKEHSSRAETCPNQEQNLDV
jgi:hypothetical protein